MRHPFHAVAIVAIVVSLPLAASAQSSGVVSAREISRTLFQGNVDAQAAPAPSGEEANAAQTTTTCSRALGPCISLPAVQFEFGSAELTAIGQEQVRELGLALVSDTLPTGMRIGIHGHTDAVGSEEYNQGLSERRAQTVATTLYRNYGVEPQVMVVEGFGESQLLLPFDPEAAENRRVEVTIIDQPTAQMQQ